MFSKKKSKKFPSEGQLCVMQTERHITLRSSLRHNVTCIFRWTGLRCPPAEGAVHGQTTIAVHQVHHNTFLWGPRGKSLRTGSESFVTSLLLQLVIIDSTSRRKKSSSLRIFDIMDNDRFIFYLKLDTRKDKVWNSGAGVLGVKG